MLEKALRHIKRFIHGYNVHKVVPNSYHERVEGKYCFDTTYMRFLPAEPIIDTCSLQKCRLEECSTVAATDGVFSYSSKNSSVKFLNPLDQYSLFVQVARTSYQPSKGKRRMSARSTAVHSQAQPEICIKSQCQDAWCKSRHEVSVDSEQRGENTVGS